MKSQTVCLIGGSGFVGRHVANMLCGQGLAVRIPTRRRELVKSELIVLPTAEVIEANINDPQVLAELMTGCDAVMIARAAIGNPFIFGEITAAMNDQPWQSPAVDRVVTTLLDHMQREIALKGPRTGLNRMKRHFASYLRGYPRVAELRKAVFATNDIPTIRTAFEDYRSAYADIQINSAAPAGETVS